ncbi:hypothetical protein AAF712_001636 [Marasmius tenuissimus]|uniref:Uncharacterized protein n=1 Tax=Marasmius tenuissimus TaxID=585030 RepID=A0ABR3ABY2_9AGAR
MSSPPGSTPSLIHSPPLDRGPLILLAAVSLLVALNLFRRTFRRSAQESAPAGRAAGEDARTAMAVATPAASATIAAAIVDLEQGRRPTMNPEMLSEQLQEALHRKWMVNDLISLYNASRLDEHYDRGSMLGGRSQAFEDSASTTTKSTSLPHGPKMLPSTSRCNSVYSMLAKFTFGRAEASDTSKIPPALSRPQSSRSYGSSTISLSNVSISMSVESHDTIESYATASEMHIPSIAVSDPARHATRF